MIETKVSLDLRVQGARMLSSQVCEKNTENYEESRIFVKYAKGKDKKLVKELIVIKLRKQELVSQHINICKEAYEEMLKTPVPEFSKTKGLSWNSLSKREKLKKHFDLIAHDLKAVSYTFDIIDD